MGNDIPPLRLEIAGGTDPMAGATPAGEVSVRVKPVRESERWQAPPPPQFDEVTKFRDVEPLDAARRWGSESLRLADRARWEAGVASASAERGNNSFAAEVSVTAIKHAAAARFLSALMTSAIDKWCTQNPGRAPSLGIDQMSVRVHRDIENAVKVAEEASGKVDSAMTQDPRD